MKMSHGLDASLDDAITSTDPDLLLATSSAAGVAGNGMSTAGFLTDTSVVIDSDADNLIAGDTNTKNDIFLKNLTTGAITRISTTSTGAQANGDSSFEGMTTNGNGLLFSSSATNLFAGGSGNGTPYGQSLYYKNLTTGVVQQVDTSATGVHGNGFFSFGQFMHDETKVLLVSDSSNLIANDTNGTNDVFIKNLTTGAITLVSSSTAGVIGNGASYGLQISADDSKVYVFSAASNLVTGDTNSGTDIFMKNVTTGAMTRISTTTAGAQINGSSAPLYITANGNTMLFLSDGTNLASGDTNGGIDIFSKNLTTGVVTLLSSSSAGVIGNAESEIQTATLDGMKIVFSGESTNLVTGDTNGSADVFFKDVATGTTTRIFTADAHRDGDVYEYSAQFADNNNKLVLSVTYHNENDDNAALLNGGISATTTSIYVIDMATFAATLLTSGSSGTVYGPNFDLQNFYTNGFLLESVSPDTEHVMLAGQQSVTGLLDPPSMVTNDYVATLTATSLQKNVGDSHANTLTGAAGTANFMFGFAGNDTLTGNTGNDFIDGGTGADVMRGAAGNDTYYVDNTGDIVREYTGQGTDTVNARVSFTLDASVENMVLFSTGNINATGNGMVNVLTGNSGNNVLNGLAGADTMSGGMGNDTYVVDSSGDVVTEDSGAGTDTVMAAIDYTLGADVENLTLTGTAGIKGVGNSLDNILTGNTGNNSLVGGDGKDTLNGGGGTDIMKGGAGDDTYVTDGGDTLTEYTNAGNDTVQSSVTYTLGSNLENLTLTGAGNINGTGNSLVNNLTGNAGNNVLDGAAGADTMRGGLGDDTYVVYDAGDVVIEAASGGTDTVNAGVSYSIAGQSIETLNLVGTGNFNGTGNSLVNALLGNSGNNVLNGMGGADTMTGGDGDDTFYVDNVGDVVNEATGQGVDKIFSSVTYTLAGRVVENMTLTGTGAISATGNGLDNILIGNTGANTLNGGYGHDTLTGGSGADTFLFSTSSGADTISDFTAAQNDHINVNAYTHGTAHTAYIVQVGGDVHINLGGTNVITVTAATVADVTAHMVW